MSRACRIVERVYRSGRIGWTALCVWLRYKTPRWWDRLLRRDPDARDMAAIHQRNADQIFHTAVAMRGMLVKMCQVIGTRSDVFPPQYVKMLSQCHDRLPPRDFATIRRVVEEDFGEAARQTIFSEFRRRPVAAASLAQVHRARLRRRRVKSRSRCSIPTSKTSSAPTSRRRGASRRIYQRFDSQPDGLPAAARRDAAAPEARTRLSP